jgi:hypothetical protein
VTLPTPRVLVAIPALLVHLAQLAQLEVPPEVTALAPQVALQVPPVERVGQLAQAPPSLQVQVAAQGPTCWWAVIPQPHLQLLRLVVVLARQWLSQLWLCC